MAAAMDERVVAMEFDNKSFEKNVKTSMKTIDDLKESLNFEDSVDGLDEISQKFKQIGKNNVFGSIDNTVSALESNIRKLGFSTESLASSFLKAFKIEAVFKAAKSAVDSLERSIKQFTIAPISEGLEKLNTKIGAIKTISNATGLAAETVNSSLEKLNWFTDETSASFGNMVENIGKFTSVGKGLTESITAMEGIATWGYHSGAGVQEINRAMYNLSQALGQGSVKLMDWKSIENAGMATKEFKEQALQAAEAAGTLKRKNGKLYTNVKGSKTEEVTTANFNATLAKGWFTSDVLMDTLEIYGGFADELKAYQDKHPGLLAAEAMEQMDKEREENRERYLEALGNLINKDTETDEDDPNAELAKKTKMSADQIEQNVTRINKITNTEERKKEIKAFAKTTGLSVDELTKYLDDLADCEETLGEKAFKSSQQAKNFTEAIEATKDAVSTQWMNTFQHIFGGLDESIQLWTDVTELMWDLFAAGGDTRNNAFKHWAEEFGGRENLWGRMNEEGEIVGGVLHNIMDPIIELKDLLASSFKDVFFSGISSAINRPLSDVEKISNAMNGIVTEDQLIYTLQGSYMGRELKKITQGMEDFTAKIRDFLTNEDNLKKIGKIFTGIASVVKFAFGIVGGFFQTIGDVIEKTGIFQDALDIITWISEKVQGVLGRIEESGFITTLLGKIGNTLTWFYERLKTWGDQIYSFLKSSGILDAVRGFFKQIETFFLGGEEDIDENGEKTESAFFRAFGWVQNVKDWLDNINLKDILDNIKYFIDNFATIWSFFTMALNGQGISDETRNSARMDSRLLGIVEAVSSFGLKIHGALGWVMDIWNNFTGWLETSGILPTLRSWWEGISFFFENIGLVWDRFVLGKNIDPKTLDKSQFSLLMSIGKFIGNVKTKFEWIKSKFIEVKDSVLGWLEDTGILPTIRKWWDGIKTFFENIGLIWDRFVLGKSIDPKSLDKKQFSLLMSVGKFIGKAKNLFNKLKGWFDTAVSWVSEKWQIIVDWLESSGILPKIREVWNTVTSFFGNIGLLWDIFVNKQGAYNPEDLTEDQLSIVQKIENFISKVREKFEWIKSKFNQIKETVLGWLEGSGILPTLRSWWSEITGWFDSLTVPDPESENSPLASVKKFFAGLYETVSGWFGGGEKQKIEVPGVELPDVDTTGGDGSDTEKKLGFFSQMLANIQEAFTNEDGTLNLSKGFSTSISKGIAFIAETFSSIDFKGAFDAVFSFVTSGINALDDALARDKIHYKNIKRVLYEIMAFFMGFNIVKTVSNFFTTIRTIVKKGNDKSVLEQFTDLLKALGEALLRIGLAVALVAGAAWVIGRLDEKQFSRALDMLTKIGLFMAGFTVIVSLLSLIPNASNTLKAVGQMFLHIGIAVGLIVVSIWAMAQMLGENGEISGKLLTAMLVVGGIMIVMVGVVAALAFLTKKVGTVNISIAISTFAGMSILIATMTVCILLLQGVKFVQALKSAVLLGAMLIAIAFAIRIAANIKIEGKILGVFVVFAAMIALITVALVLLQDADQTQMLVIAALLVGVLYAMVGAAKIASKIKIDKKIVGTLTIFAFIIGILTAAFLLLKDVDQTQMLVIASIFSGTLLAIIGLAFLASKLDPAATLKGGLAVAAFIAAVAAGFAAAGLIISATAKKLVNDLVTIMSSLNAAGISAESIDAQAILNGIGLLKDVAKAFTATTGCDTSVALQVAQDTWIFLGRMRLASFAAKQIDVEQFKAIFGEDGKGGILKIIQEGLASVENTGGKAAVLGYNLEKLGNSLQLVGESGLSLNRELVDADGLKTGETYAQGIQNLKDRLGDIQEIIALATTVGLTGWMATSVGTNVEALGNSLIAVGQSGTQLEDNGKYAVGISNVKKRLTDIQEIVQTAISLATTGEGTVTDDALEAFSLGIMHIGSALQIYNEALKTFEEEDAKINGVETTVPTNTEKIKEALQAVISTITETTLDQSKIDSVKGWAGLAENGDGGQSEFALGLVTMANALAAFSKSAGEFDSTNSEKAIGALDMLANIFNKVQSPSDYTDQIAGVAGWGVGKGGANASFANSIIGMGGALAVFSRCAMLYNETSGEKAISALNMLAEIKNKVGTDPSQYNGTIEGIAGWDKIGDVNSKGTFANAIVGMGNAMRVFGNSVSGMPTDAVAAATRALSTLTTIYNKVKDNERSIEYFASDTFGSTGKSPVEVFTSFSEGISKLGDGLAAFGAHVSKTDGTYDATKVEQATGVLEAFAAMETALVECGADKPWWSKSEDLSVMGENIAGLGARLQTFQTELGDFDIGIESDKWKNASGVLSYFVAQAKELAKIEGTIQRYDAGANATSYQVAYSLVELSNGIEAIAGAMGKFTEALNTVYYEADAYSGENNTDKPMKIGEWAEAQWNSVKTVLDAMKEITVALGSAGLKEGNFYDLDHFGYDLKQLLNYLGESKLTEVISSFTVPEEASIDTNAFVKFIDSVKTLADATVSLKNSNVSRDDVNNVVALIQGLTGVDTTGWLNGSFNTEGINMATEFLNGFLTKLSELSKGEVGEGATIQGAMDIVVSTVASYWQNFYDQGFLLGQAIAKGISDGMNGTDPTTSISPIVSMDAEGNVTGGSLTTLLRSMNYATSADISEILTRIDTLNGKIGGETPIAVNDSHEDVVVAVKELKSQLTTMNDRINTLAGEMSNLKVYMNSGVLVGEIVGDMDRALGQIANQKRGRNWTYSFNK